LLLEAADRPGKKEEKKRLGIDLEPKMDIV
jgi:hypothetical protein